MRNKWKSLSRGKKVALLGLFVFLVTTALMADSCDGTTTSQQQAQQQQNTSANDRLHKAEPYPVLNDSQELHNQREWYLRLNDPNKVAYVYLFSQGKLVAEYQIIAKCSSTNSQYSTPSEVHYDQGTAGGGNIVVPAPQPDGSYGANENAVFCFLNDAHRTMIEFSEAWQYLWSETPLQLTTPPEIVIVPNGK